MNQTDYLVKNKIAWDKRTEVHLTSKFYDVAGFKAGKSSLSQIEMDLLGDVSGKTILHLQCHFGQDSISLAKLGATVTAVDFSEPAIEAGRRLAEEMDVQVTFICQDLYSLPDNLNETFDIVYASYGIVGWLPDLNKWARVIATFLRKSGTLIFIDFHPFAQMFDENFETIKYSYFNRGANLFLETGTYADKTAPVTQEYLWWDHSLSDIINNLISNGLTISCFKEYDYAPFSCFAKTKEVMPGKYRIQEMNDKLPMVFSIEARY